MAKEKKKSAAAAEQQDEKVKATGEPAVTEETEQEPTPEEKLEAELAQSNDNYLRLAAEYSNFRNRTQREKDALAGDVKANVISQLLPILDNFERAAENSEASFEDYKKGVEMTFTQFTDIFGKLGVETFGSQGETFDPKLHNAVMHTDSEDFEENTISKVFTKGYKLGERIIRCAIVEVAN